MPRTFHGRLERAALHTRLYVFLFILFMGELVLVRANVTSRQTDVLRARQKITSVYETHFNMGQR